MLWNHQIEALKVIVSAAQETPPVLWAVTGSTSFVLQGMSLEAHDIDIQTDEASAYELGNRLKKYEIEPVHFCGTEKIRSHFGRLKICGTDVEIMGEIQKRLPDGSWERKFSLPPLIRSVDFEGMRIPVLSLAHEAAAYRKLGRTERADEIERFLASNGSAV